MNALLIVAFILLVTAVITPKLKPLDPERFEAPVGGVCTLADHTCVWMFPSMEYERIIYVEKNYVARQRKTVQGEWHTVERYVFVEKK